MEVESVLICRACMKSDGIFFSIWGDDMEQKNLPDKLADITDIQIDKEDGLPTVLCPKCAYRTSAFYDFKRQVQETQIKLRKMFSIEPEPSSITPNPSNSTEREKSEEEYILDSINCSPTEIEEILADTNYPSPPAQSPEDPSEGIPLTADSNDLQTSDTLDKFLTQNPSEFSIDQGELIKKEDIPNELLEILESEDVFTLVYIPSEDPEFDLTVEQVPEQEQEIQEPEQEELQELEEDSTEFSTKNLELTTSPLPQTSRSPKKMKKIKKIPQTTESDSDEYRNQPSNLLGTVNDTLIKIKELKTPSGVTYQCSLCMTNYDELSAVLSHTADTHIPSTGPFFCVLCEKDCTSQKDLRCHMKTHTGSYPYSCFLCEKAYTSKSYLKRHMRCHPDFLRYRCPKCGERFKMKPELHIHTATHLHGAPYVCSKCSRIFQHKGNYKKHLMTHLDPQAVRLGKYPCDMCGKKFMNNRTLQTHMRVHTGEKPFVCQVCNRAFSQQGNLLNHMRIHSNPRSYTCEVCGKKFNQRATLKDHSLLHTGEKPYVCNVCGKAFTFSAALRRHMWVHASDKPYGCDLCSSRFVGRYDLNRHMKIHTDLPRQKRRRKIIVEQEDDGDHPLAVDSMIVDEIPVVEDDFVEQVLMEDDGEHIGGQEESEKENVDALFDLIKYS